MCGTRSRPSRVTVPVEVDDLTPAWFTSVLRHRDPDCTVTGVEVLAAHSGTTGRARVGLSYPGATSLPPTMFVKLQPFDPDQRRLLAQFGIGVSETRFYAALGGGVPVRAPATWHAETDGNDFVMVLEDLEASGCRFPSPRDADVEARAWSTVEELAHLHAAFWASDRFAGDLAWVPERAGFGGGTGKDGGATRAAGGFMRMALDQFADDMPPVFRRLGGLYADRAPDILDLWDEGERTLIHGDAHMGNLFVDDGRTGFLDWAMVSRSPGMRDVAYFCCNSVPPDVRRAHEGALLDRYRDVLASHGVRFDADAAFEQYRLFAVYSWVSATSTAAMGSRWQPAAVGRGGMARATAAVDDLDSVGLLEERLS